MAYKQIQLLIAHWKHSIFMVHYELNNVWKRVFFSTTDKVPATVLLYNLLNAVNNRQQIPIDYQTYCQKDKSTKTSKQTTDNQRILLSVVFVFSKHSQRQGVMLRFRSYKQLRNLV